MVGDMFKFIALFKKEKNRHKCRTLSFGATTDGELWDWKKQFLKSLLS